MPESLYTTTDIKRVREGLIKKQQGIDPILKEPFSEIPVCDHDHTTQHVRAALNRNTNAFEGLVFNAYKRCLKWMTKKPLPDILRNLADYLEQDYSDQPYHNAWIKKVKTYFNALKEPQKDAVLVRLGVSTGTNGKERKDAFNKAVLSRQFSYDQLKEVIQSAK
jgi:uncharacterized radical SAM superfamily Fe-S cluster-containing enzyme